MTLSFSTKWPERMGELAGKPNYFTNKIMKSMWQNHAKEVNKFIFSRTDTEKNRFEVIKPFENLTVYDVEKLRPKLHTIRRDEHNRWKSGRDIHMVINSRTKDRFQFAPVVKCVSVQTIEIVHRHIKHGRAINVYVDGQIISGETLERIALNDGFDTVDDFVLYFNENFTGKLIHWTDLKY